VKSRGNKRNEQTPPKVFLLLIALVFASSSSEQLLSEPEIHLIPTGFMGYIYIFHNVPDGQPLKREARSRVYEIPKDGILRSQSPLNPGWGQPATVLLCNARWHT
jgi:hypothetical protein